MFIRIFAVLFTFALIGTAAAETPSDIDTRGFEKLTAEALEHRAERTLDSEKFLELMARDDVLILDTRSAKAFAQKHLEGAVHLNFSDFDVHKLAAAIPSKDTTILIYCNNNVVGDPTAFARKMAPMALNIPTFVNLYAYGYRDVYELGAMVNVNDPRFVFEGSTVKPR